MHAIDINHPLPESEEEKLTKEVERENRLTNFLMFGVPTLLVLGLAGYIVHVLVTARISF
jgi:hypothetical protein